jgi:hypothetical protein
MTTVPKADTPPPANNAKTTLLQSDENLYVRPTAGGNASGAAEGALGSAPLRPPAGSIPDNPIMGGLNMVPPAGSLSTALADPSYPEANAGASPSTGGTQAGPDMGHGATIVVNDSGDRESGAPDASVSWGTVGESVNQP